MVVEEAYWVANESIEWSINVIKNLNDWEICEYEELLKLLALQQILTTDDQIMWKLEKKGNFSVSSYLQIFEQMGCCC